MKPKNSDKNNDIRSLAADLVYKASWREPMTAEGAVVEIVKIAEKAANKALEDLEKDFIGRLPLPFHKEIVESLKRSYIMDAYAWAFRTTKQKIKDDYHILTQEEVEHENISS